MADIKNNIASELQDKLLEIPEQHEIIDAIEGDINIPPAQDSPKHILNILNDYCIQAILLKLDNILDFYNAAKVCTRFQMNAQTVCFPFKDILFNEVLTWKDDNEGKYPISIQHAKEFFSIFGQFVKSIKCEQTIEHVDLILNYCRKNLVKLDIAVATNGSAFLNSKFESLEELELRFISAISADLFPKLRKLYLFDLEYSNMFWIANEFPHLKKVYFYDVENLYDQIFIKFQTHNPQLEELSVHKCENITSLVWRDIGKRLPNLVCLSLQFECMDQNVVDICTLQKLREITLIKFDGSCDFFGDLFDGDYDDSLKPLFDLFVDRNLLIEKLSINQLSIDNEAAMSLQKLKMIKDLTISETPEEIVLDIVKELPALEHLKISGSYNSTDQWIIDEILKHAVKLTKLRFNGKEIKIDVNE